jgi:hypothetical protein
MWIFQEIGVMPGYRAFEIDESGHIISPPAAINCNDDQEAILVATKLVDGRAIELWQGHRLITKIAAPARPPDGPYAASADPATSRQTPRPVSAPARTMGR